MSSAIKFNDYELLKGHVQGWGFSRGCSNACLIYCQRSYYYSTEKSWMLQWFLYEIRVKPFF